MPNIENLLLVEFAEQHSSRRHLETISFQIVQLFFTFQGIVITGLFGLFALNFSFNRLMGILSIAFLFLFLFGHLARGIALETMMVGFELDLPLTLVRHYYSRNEANRPYIAFARDMNELEFERVGQWERLGEVNLVPRFITIINGFNLIATIGLINYFVLVNFFPAMISLVSTLEIWLGLPLLLLSFAIFRFYIWFAFTKPLRVREARFLTWQASCIQRLKAIAISDGAVNPMEKGYQ